MSGEFDIAVIGGGVAGLTAAHHALLGGCTVGHVLGTEPIGGLVCNVGELHGYPSGSEPLSGIAMAVALSAANAELGGTEFYDDAAALAIDSDQFRISLGDGEVSASQVILATGASLRKLDVPGAEALFGRGVSQCAWCDGPLYSGKDVVVVGGGDAGLEEALHLAQHAAKVTIVTRGDRLRARQSYVDRIAALPSVDVRLSSDVVEVFGADGVEAVRIDTRNNAAREDLQCQGVFVFIGLEPNGSLVRDLAELDANGCVVTTLSGETATPGLFAIGAVRSGYGGRLVHAVSDAANAAMAAVANCKS